MFDLAAPCSEFGQLAHKGFDVAERPKIVVARNLKEKTTCAEQTTVYDFEEELICLLAKL